MKKKILFVGKVNEVVKSLNDYLVKYYTVQLSSPGTSTVMGMIMMVEPDLILISLIGSVDIEMQLFDSINKSYPRIPVITIGTESEARKFSGFYILGQFKNLNRPIGDDKVADAIADRLGITLEKSVLDEMSLDDMDGLLFTVGAKRLNVLIVDDNAATLRSLKAMLDDLYDITICPSGIKAIGMIQKSKPDVILLDYEMPVVDGKRTFEMIKAENDFKDIPVIFLTGVSDREHIEAVLALRPAGYILKPPAKEKLVATITAATNPSAR